MDDTRITEGTKLWEPSPEFRAQSNLTKYAGLVKEEYGLEFESYEALWDWSVSNLGDFWELLSRFYKIQFSKPYHKVLDKEKMPGASWFEGAELNYAQHVFRNMSTERPALLFQSERHPLTPVSWDELYRQTASVAASLKEMGVGRGDRVAAFMPNIPQTTIAFLAVNSLGAIWSSCSPDFGTRAVIDRFRQIDPKVLFAVDGYQYGGKGFNCLPAIAELRDELETLEQTVMVPYLDSGFSPDNMAGSVLWNDLSGRDAELEFEQVPFDHPIWVVYSSGTTGLPKPLVHGHGGIVLEMLKFLSLHMDVKPGDRFFWFSTTGWVMWNIVQGALLTGATSIIYDGNPAYPDLDVLWKMAEKSGMNLFGTSAAYLTACMNSHLKPGRECDLSKLKAVGSTGSPLSPDGFAWIYDHVKPDVWLCSVSGGTDPCSGFIGSSPWLPVHAGELQCRCLAVAADAFDENGNSLVEEVGELVIKKPMPSMPLYLWKDEGGRRYRESYFEIYPGVWRHGDWIKITPRGSAVITGRSDSTINRFGVRMGSSEIYAVVEDLVEVEDSLVLGYETQVGGYFMPLFVVLAEGRELDDETIGIIKSRIRTVLSPRHVPDAIIAVPEVPRTLNQKKLEVPIKRILQGVPVEKAVNMDSMSNPHVIEVFADLYDKWHKESE